MSTGSYLDFAEADYAFLMDAYNCGIVGNAFCSIASTVCERYLKHILQMYAGGLIPVDVMCVRSLSELLWAVRRFVPDFSCDVQAVRKVGRYYFEARYPGETSCFVTNDDIVICYDGMVACRKAVLDYCSSHAPGEVVSVT